MHICRIEVVNQERDLNVSPGVGQRRRGNKSYQFDVLPLGNGILVRILASED